MKSKRHDREVARQYESIAEVRDVMQKIRNQAAIDLWVKERAEVIGRLTDPRHVGKLMQSQLFRALKEKVNA